jgi:hypothetical protein
MSIFLELDADQALLARLAAGANVDVELLEGGVATIPASWLNSVEFLSVALFSTFGQRTAETVEDGKDAGRKDHVMIDRYYQQMWPGSWSGYRSLYGSSGIDHGTPKVGLPSTAIRVRHRRLPAYVVRTPQELERIAEECRSIVGESGHVLFRGQNRQYILSRTPAAKRLLFGEGAVVVEPSLLTSAHRGGRDGDHLIGLLQFELQDLVLSSHDLAAQVGRVVSEVSGGSWTGVGATKSAPDDQETWWRRPGAGAHAREVLALAQHYAIPSYGLDMSASLAVATWFALYEAYEVDKERSWFRKLIWGGDEPEAWPCVYFATIDSLERERYELLGSGQIEATRPVRQEAFMLHGGWGWHSNLSAEQLVAVAYLAPDFIATGLPTADYLFPGPRDDAFYDWLLRRRAIALAQSDSPVREVYESMPVFLNPSAAAPSNHR